MSVRATEEQYQNAIVELAQLGGWRFYHPLPARTNRGYRTLLQGHPGYFDLTLFRELRLLFVELKLESKRPNPEQERWIQAARLIAERCPLVQVHVWQLPRDLELAKKVLQ